MKKLIALLSVVLLLVTMFPVVSAEDNKYNDTDINWGPHTTHVYDNCDDLSCNVCGALRSAGHVYDHGCDSDCNYCGFERPFEGHVYEMECDPDCDVCGEVREIRHVYVDCYDETCNLCGDVREVTGHVYDNSCDNTCNVCGSTRETGHSFGEGSCTDTVVCSKCGETRTLQHEFTPTTCTAPATCTICGVTQGTAFGHSYTNDCDNTCDICGEIRNAGHNYTQATCTEPSVCTVCGVTGSEALGHRFVDTICTRCFMIQPVYVGDVEMADGTYLAVGSTTTTTIKPEDNYAYFKDGMLTLHNYSYTGAGIPMADGKVAIYRDGILAINLEGDNYIAIIDDTMDTAAIGATGTCAILADSEASLTVVAADYGIYAIEDATYGCLISLADITLDITATKCGIFACENGSIAIENCELEISAGDHVMEAADSITIVPGEGQEILATTEIGGDRVAFESANVTTYKWMRIHAHVYDDDTDATCNVCGERREVGCSHVWMDATCTAPKTCSACGSTEGEALGHTAGANADCANAQICTVCGAELNAALGHNYNAVVTAPTCTNGGYTTYTCSACGDSYVADETAARGHNYNAVVTEPDCISEGYTTYTCIACGDTYVADRVDALPHDYDAEVTAPTCTTGGYTTYTCATCGGVYVYDKTDALGHTAGPAADCENDQICTVCEVVLKPATGHKYLNVTIAPNCTSGGKTTHTCFYCKDSYEDGQKAALGHKYDNACDTSCNRCKATRTTKHKYTNACDKTCNICGATRTIKHTYTNSCDKTCNVCKATRTIKHTYTNACDTKCNVCSATRTIKHDYKAATCTAPKTCKVCKATTGKALGHKYTNACDTSCNTCKATRKITHKYTTVTKKATATANGYTVKRCSVCKKETGKTTIYKASTIKLAKTAYVYNGKAVKPSVTIKDSKGKTIASSNYTVTYASGRKNVGTYKVTIKFKGKYSGTKTLTFKINPAGTTVSKVTAAKKKLTINVTKKTAQVSGYEIQYATNKSFKSAKSKTLTKTSLSLTGLKAKTTYYIRVRTYKTVNGKKVYSAWSTVKSAKTK